MLTDIFLLLLSLAVILTACEVFTNAIEWVGHRLRLGEGAVGSLLAAVGTAMPETLIPVVALVSGGEKEAHREVAIGAILGAPFMLATLAMFITGTAVLIFHRTQGRSMALDLEHSVIGRDLSWFLGVLSLATAVAFLPAKWAWLRFSAAAMLVLIYGAYVTITLRHGGALQDHDSLPPLRFCPRSTRPPLWLVGSQASLGLAAIIGGAHLFVQHVTALAEGLSVPALVLSLIIAPIATELPEKFNSVLWVRQGKDTLALGNLTGAMVFQSAIPPALGIVLTPWRLQPQALASVVMAVVSASILVAAIRVRGRLTAPVLLSGGGFYLAYLVMLFWLGHGG